MFKKWIRPLIILVVVLLIAVPVAAITYGEADEGETDLRSACSSCTGESGAWGCHPTNPSAALVCCSQINSDNKCEPGTEIDMFADPDDTGPDNIDNDCDGVTDEGTTCAGSVYLTITTAYGSDFDMFAYEASLYDAVPSSTDPDDSGSWRDLRVSCRAAE